AAAAVSDRPRFSSLSAELPHIREVAGHGGGGGHRRADQMGFRAGSLAALEIAVRGRGDALAVLGAVVVHRHAVRAAGFAPFETGFEEDAVEAFLLGLVLDVSGTRHDH